MAQAHDAVRCVRARSSRDRSRAAAKRRRGLLTSSAAAKRQRGLLSCTRLGVCALLVAGWLGGPASRASAQQPTPQAPAPTQQSPVPGAQNAPQNPSASQAPPAADSGEPPLAFVQ